MDLKIGIIGFGFVGKATRSLFNRIELRLPYETVVYDVDPERNKTGWHLDEVVNWADILSLALPTPSSNWPDIATKGWKGFDMKILSHAIDDIMDCLAKGKEADKIIQVRSTIPIDYIENCERTWKLGRFVHVPEFLTESKWEEDILHPGRVIVGTNDRISRAIITNMWYNIYKELKVRGDINEEPEIISTEPQISALIKLANNAYLANKVTFFNVLYDLCERLDIDWGEFKDIFVLEGRLERHTGNLDKLPNHTQVPGPDGKLGYGGHCLSKDVDELIKTIDLAGGAGDFFKAMVGANLIFREGKK